MATFNEKLAALHESHPNLCGRTYALLSAVCTAFTVIVVKLIDKKISFATLGSAQGAIGVLFAHLMYGRSQSPYPADSKVAIGLFLRGFLGALVGVFIVLGFKVVPPQKGIVLLNTTTLWVVFLGMYFLNEYPNKLILSMIFLMFLGVILLIDPSLILPSRWLPPSQIDMEVNVPIYYYLLPMSGGISGAAVTVYLKIFSGQVTPYMNSFWYFMFLTFWMGVVMEFIPFSEEALRPSIKDILLMIIFGFLGNGYQFFLALSARYEKRTSIISMLANFQIVLAYILDYIILGHQIEPVNAIGGLIIISATITIAFSKESLSTQAQTLPQTVGGETQPHPK